MVRQILNEDPSTQVTVDVRFQKNSWQRVVSVKYVDANGQELAEPNKFAVREGSKLASWEAGTDSDCLTPGTIYPTNSSDYYTKGSYSDGLFPEGLPASPYFPVEAKGGAKLSDIAGIPGSKVSTLKNPTLDSGRLVFKGWATKDADGKLTPIVGGSTMPKDSDETLYAQWGYTIVTDNTDANQRASVVYYHLNNEADFGSAVASFGTPKKEGYRFLYWTFGDGTKVPVGTLQSGLRRAMPRRKAPAAQSEGAWYSYLHDGVVIIVAVWEAKPVQVTYDANGGEGAPEPGSATCEKAYAVVADQPTRAGYEFSGWNAKVDGSGTVYKASDTWKPTTAQADANVGLTLFAQWTPRTVAVNYDANGGEGAPEPGTATFGQDFSLAAAQPTRTGYTFAGWNTAADGTGTNFAPGAAWRLPAEQADAGTALDLYAQWTPRTVAVTYDANGGEGAPEPGTATFGSDYTVSGVEPTRAGYTFSGWKDADGNDYAAGDAWQLSAEDADAGTGLTLIAQWTPVAADNTPAVPEKDATPTPAPVAPDQTPAPATDQTPSAPDQTPTPAPDQTPAPATPAAAEVPTPTVIAATPAAAAPAAPAVTPALTPAPAAPATVAIPDGATPLAAPAPAPAAPATPAGAPGATIADDATPLAAPEGEKIPDEATPEAAPAVEFVRHCVLHWYAMLGAAATALLGFVSAGRRRKEAEDMEKAESSFRSGK